MNYGRYFRLNQALSKVVSGVAIYDYVDLPAYFGPSVDNPMSPKYPISMTITADAVCFRLHYSAFKIEKRKKENDEPNEKPRYAYTKEDLDEKAFVENNMSLSNLGMAHMEEVILELPYINTVSKNLSDTIKDIYSTTFPLVEDENTSMGGRFLEQIIRKRFPSGNDIQSKESTGKDDTNRIEDDLYKKLREISDNTASYSSLWLMDLYKGDRIDLYKKDNNDLIVGFLRKLLLDFMFDLKHSDIFQNSACYQKMYSGLMSDFYFSALMHKCEYYYYRELTRSAIKGCHLENKKERESIITLYAEELFRAESNWVQDIMSPLAENYFENQGINERLKEGNSVIKLLCRIKSGWRNAAISENSEFYSWPSWFADSEEEMRRVCFKTKDNSGGLHICNADTLVECLRLEGSENQIAKEMISSRNRNREMISKWFFSRYDFNDTFHLHLFRYSNHLICLLLLGLLLWFFQMDFFTKALSFLFDKWIFSITMICYVFIPIIGTKIWDSHDECNDKNWGKLVRARNRLVGKRIISFIVHICLIVGISIEVANEGWIMLIALMTFYLTVIFLVFSWFRFPRMDFISKLHLFLPRPVAAITFAWLTISMGFDIYVSFFDALPSQNYEIFITIVVFVFIMFVINRTMPACSSLRKVHRSIELLLISYAISLAVGIVVVNFIGEKFLERGGFMNDFYEEYVNVPGRNNKNRMLRDTAHLKTTNESVSSILLSAEDSVKLNYLVNQTVKDSAESFRVQKSNLRNIYHVIKEKNKYYKIKDYSYPLVEIKEIFGLKIFIMRDFLIMFSFIAMFMGIFIQLIILGDNKQMTEL